MRDTNYNERHQLYTMNETPITHQENHHHPIPPVYTQDLYVMLRAVGVYERIVKQFTAQTTDYKRLLSTFAEGLYTEMDFRNEGLNALRMTELLLHKYVYRSVCVVLFRVVSCSAVYV